MIKEVKEELLKVIDLSELEDLTDKEIEEIIINNIKTVEPVLKASNLILEDKDKLEKFKELILSFIDTEI